jgi:hypothetical protein
MPNIIFWSNPIDPSRVNEPQRGDFTMLESSEHVPGQLPSVKIGIKGSKLQGVPFVSFKQCADAIDKGGKDDVDLCPIQKNNIMEFAKTGEKYLKTLELYTPPVPPKPPAPPFMKKTL